jgi:hypothetical protein
MIFNRPRASLFAAFSSACGDGRAGSFMDAE